MSNHVHGIIIVEKSGIVVETPKLGVSTNNTSMNKSYWKSENSDIG
ncbi:hypothetical protein KAR10_03420 [bacterium]|nr:hypothetical protein [bacterium]